MISGCTDKNVHTTGLSDHLLFDHYLIVLRAYAKNRNVVFQSSLRRKEFGDDLCFLFGNTRICH